LKLRKGKMWVATKALREMVVSHFRCFNVMAATTK